MAMNLSNNPDLDEIKKLTEEANDLADMAAEMNSSLESLNKTLDDLEKRLDDYALTKLHTRTKMSKCVRKM